MCEIHLPKQNTHLVWCSQIIVHQLLTTFMTWWYLSIRRANVDVTHFPVKLGLILIFESLQHEFYSSVFKAVYK